ncbi:NUDIX domain-containing protein [Ancylobacter sp. Lp-2]|uniref:NUDIX hydrolase n=1 Tax=Ancylobacter sp. Lp-2 TaxID=2881339 RepID=UPI001E37EFD5|nr:NUDIX domain-containing protein [Ancylobacter sp. Lp-2]MCB4768526.1 NUDIX domain-containing protein [Ancylobacter sp. Lp-2]
MTAIDVSARFAVARPDTSHPYRRPVDAATLILVDRSARTPRVLLGRRNPAQKFMPGKLVFPGGRVDPQDRNVPVYGMLDSVSERRLQERVVRPSLARARALALAAIRETCEETGLVIGSREAGAPDAMPAGWEAFAQAGAFPNLEALSFVARAVTPPGLSRRFDTRFFMADASEIAHRLPDVVGPQSEFVELAWLTLAEAKKAEVPTITHAILEEVETRLAGGNKPWLPVPYYVTRHGRMMREALE